MGNYSPIFIIEIRLHCIDSATRFAATLTAKATTINQTTSSLKGFMLP